MPVTRGSERADDTRPSAKWSAFAGERKYSNMQVDLNSKDISHCELAINY